MTGKQHPPQYIETGHISGCHGLHGTLIVHSETRPITAIGNYEQWWLGTDTNKLSPFQVERCWLHSRKLLIQLEGIANRSDADRLRHLRIFILSDAIIEEKEAFLWHRLIGCSVTTEAGTTIGIVCRVEAYGSSDILIVTDNNRGGEWMIPFTQSIMGDIDLDNQTITVNLPDGMDACFSPNC